MSTEQKVNEQVLHIQQKDKTINNMDVFNELKRRVDLTRRARIKASDRLREKHEFFEKTSYFYSVVVLILSIWFIEGKGDIPKVLLISSLSLTFFTMFLGVKSYKERASNFENNYQQLNVLLNKLQRLEADSSSIDQMKLKELHRDYEKLILEKENHISIDYMTCKPDHEVKYKKEISRYVWRERLQRCIVFCLPLIIWIVFINK